MNDEVQFAAARLRVRRVDRRRAALPTCDAAAAPFAGLQQRDVLGSHQCENAPSAT
jgi:hypothetical protein